MKKRVKFALPLVVVIILVMSFVSAKAASDIRVYGKLINYVGIVRGASQRVIKLETNEMPDEDLIDYVNGIMEELLSGEGRYGLARTDCEKFNDQLEQLDEKWSIIKREIVEVRAGADKKQLLRESEELFEIANKAVFAIDEYSSEQSQGLAKMMISTAVFCLAVSVAVITYYVKKYFKLHKMAEILADQAGRDELTGALNTERFYTDAQKIIEQSQGLKVAVEYIDFENFKYINDVFGYECGDNILKKYVEFVQRSLGEHEILARSVADRFLVLRIYNEKEELLGRQKEVDELFMKMGGLPDNHTMTVACGFCCMEDVIERLDVRGLVNRANYAQKTIKNIPGDKYAFYNESIRQKMFEEIHIADQMESAIANKEFVFYLQPKVSPADNSIRAAEALVRWKASDGAFYLPGAFIPVFEKNHLIGVLDQYIYEEVCQFIRRRLDQGKKVVPISVNVSKIRFYSAGFVETYSAIKDKYAIPDGLLEIEFTETVACENIEYMIEIVKKLHQNGFMCSLDDFGTGYSSLSMLKDMDIDVLKLDAMFFKKEKITGKEMLIIKGVLQMIRSLNVKTVAEGIENKSQAEFLRDNGCDLIQGYYYYKPIPTEEFEHEVDKKDLS